MLFDDIVHRFEVADKVVNSHLLYQLSYGRLLCRLKIVDNALQRNGEQLYIIAYGIARKIGSGEGE